MFKFDLQALKWQYLWYLWMDFSEWGVKMCRNKLFIFWQPSLPPRGCEYLDLGLQCYCSETFVEQFTTILQNASILCYRYGFKISDFTSLVGKSSNYLYCVKHRCSGFLFFFSFLFLFVYGCICYFLFTYWHQSFALLQNDWKIEQWWMNTLVLLNLIFVSSEEY